MPIANARIFAGITGEYSKVLDTGSVKFPMDLSQSNDIANGTGNGQADLVFTDTRTLAASASETLDLAGVLADAFGATLTFVKIVAILVKAAPGNTNDVIVGGQGATNPFVGPFGANSHTIAVRPGGVFLIADPVGSGIGTVVAGTGDLLKIANGSSGTSVDYTIEIVGRSA